MGIYHQESGTALNFQISLGVMRTSDAPSTEEPLLGVNMYHWRFSTSINSLPTCSYWL
jgi:hypothetical protein